MSRTAVSSSLLFLLLLFPIPLLAQEEGEIRGRTLSVLASAEDDALVWATPVGLTWLKNRPVVVAYYRRMKPGAKGTTKLHRKQGDGSWETTEVEGMRYPNGCLGLNESLGIVGSTGNYGAKILFIRVSPAGKELGRTELAAAEGHTDRITVSGTARADGTLWVFLLSEIRKKEKNDLLVCRSTDGGKSWSDPILMGETTMHEDNSHFSGFAWSADRAARLVMERRGGLRLVRTEDGGKTWSSNAVEMKDELGKEALRMPIAVTQAGDDIGLLYIGAPGRSRGRYYYTHGSQQGRTWSVAHRATDPVTLEDPSRFGTLADTGKLLAANYIEVTGSWTKGEIVGRLVVSTDEGKSWTGVDTGLGERMRVCRVVAKPDGSGILYAATTVTEDGGSQVLVGELTREQ